MKNYWKENLKKIIIMFVILLFVDALLLFSNFDLTDKLLLCVINVLYIFSLIKIIINYFILKSKGVLHSKLPYYIEEVGKNGPKDKILVVLYKSEDGSETKLYSRKLPKDNLPDTGYVDVIINTNNTKNYLILYETMERK